MKNWIFILIAAFSLASCFKDNKVGCPTDMYVSFSVADPYELSETFDNRIANDVVLYIFKDQRVVSVNNIPYEAISGGKEYVIPKTEELEGNLDLLAVTVPDGSGAEGRIPSLIPGNSINDYFRELSLYTRATQDCVPIDDYQLNVGHISMNEKFDKETKYDIAVNYDVCRVEVNITDNTGVLSAGSNDPRITLYGTMRRINAFGKGVGDQAIVHKSLETLSGSTTEYTSQRFGVFPSSDGQTLSVCVYNGSTLIEELDVPTSVLPKGATSGGLIIFEHTLGDLSFTIEVDGFRQNILIVDDM